jgi:hypothetical protein
LRSSLSPCWPDLSASQVVGVILYFTVIKKPEYKLSVSKGAGVSGTPVVGTFVCRKGKKVQYSYSHDYGYRNLKVLLDGTEVAASGEFTMDRDHVLASSADEPFYGLTAASTVGVIGAPAAGIHSYTPGARVAFKYALADGYCNLRVILDGVRVAPRGEVVMETDHFLEASAELIKPPQFDVQGKWRVRAASGYGFDTQEMIFVGTPAAGSIYRPGSSSYLGKYIASGDQIMFWAYTDYAHSTDYWGTLRDANSMDGPHYRNPCDLPDGGPGTWAAVRIP